MAARRPLARSRLLLLATVAGFFPPALAQSAVSPTQSPASSETPGQQQSNSSSSSHRRHIQVAEEETPAPELAKAEGLIQKHDYAGAQGLLKNLTDNDPSNYVAWFELGFVENALGRIDNSIAAYRKSVQAKPDVFESNLNLGLQLAKTHQPDAENFLRAATQLKPTSHGAEGHFRAWLSLGHVLENNNPDEAVAAFRKAAELQPNDPETHVAAGSVFEKENRFSEAEEEYKKALAIDPSSDALTGLANIYMNGRRFPEAAEYLRKLVAAHPNQAAPHVQLGRVLAAESKYEEAVTELESGRRLAPGDVSVQRDLADLYATAGKTHEAEAAYRELVTAHPNDAELHHELGKTLLIEKNFPAAQREFFAAVKLKPEFGAAYGDLAFAASENKDYVLTIKALDARAKTLPEIPITYFLRATAYDHLQEVKKAAANYRLFLDSAHGKYPDQEWQAKHRLIAIEPKKN